MRMKSGRQMQVLQKHCFLKQRTENPDYCPSTEVDDELDRIDIEDAA